MSHPVYIGYDCPPAALRPAGKAYVKTIPKSAEHCRKRYDARRLLGLSVESARADAQQRGLEVREVVVDGNKALMTLDRSLNRIDVIVADGRVVGIRGVG
jgi:hypothetical protein